MSERILSDVLVDVGIHVDAWVESDAGAAAIAHQASTLGIPARDVRAQLLWIARERCSVEGISQSIERELPSATALRAMPKRVLHLAAGGVPGLSIESCTLAMALGSTSVCRPSRQDVLIPSFARHLADTAPACADRLQLVDRVDWTAVDAAVVYGTDDTVDHVRHVLRRGRVVGYGSRIGIALVDASAPDGWASKLADDVALFAQRGCMSPSYVFVLDRDMPSTYAALGDALAAAVDRHCSTGDDAFTARSAIDAALLDSLLADAGPGPAQLRVGPCLVAVAAATEEHLPSMLPRQSLLQTAVVAADGERFTALSQIAFAAGCTRVTRPGSAHYPPADWPHDGIGRIAPLVGVQRTRSTG